MSENIYDVLVLGGGPAGLTAALYTSRAELKTLIVAGAPSGGQLTTTTDVENYPGFPDGIQGPALVELYKKHAVKFGAKEVEENAVEISGNAKDKFKVKTDGGNEYFGRAVIISTGASAKWLPLPSVEKLRGKGVTACATCDGFFFKDKVTAVVGGGDVAMEEATFMTKFSPKVYLMIRGAENELKASKIMYTRVKENSKIEMLFNTEVVEVLGENSVEGLKIKNNQSGEESTLDDIRGLFMAIGHKPNTEFLKGFMELGKFGYIDPVDHTKTSVEGVFVGGEVGDHRYRQAVTSVAFGCMAALDAEKFLTDRPMGVEVKSLT